jgi:SP family general alpha glucoside:H+ symporter-like MFS transporter
VEHLLAGQILCGLPWGVFATLGASYSSEILPMSLRGYLTAYINLCFAMGQFIAAGVLKGLIDNDTEWSFRIPFAVQWTFIPFLLVIIFLAPDSPQWLVRKGRIDDAVKSAKRLCHKSIRDKAHERIANMIRTNELERQQEAEAGPEYTGIRGYIKCFQGTNLRRTEIGCIAFAGQVLSGSTFAYSPSYFFLQSGLNPNDTYKLNLGVTSISFTCCVLSWFLINRFGRRQIYVTGYGILTSLLLLIGILAAVPQNQGLRWAQAGTTMAWVAIYAASIGPLAFAITSEMSSTRVRHKSISLARGSYTIASLVSNVVEPYLINPTEANLKGKTGFVWFGTAICTFTWAYFRLPETKDRTYEELDILFDKRVPARKFAKYDLNLEAELIEDKQIKESL